ncbi:MAG: DUF2306 domain-containing protein [Chitinophagaceae bacterium]|nr:DUF2306 domain-containing protein [Chitinophagaceae bacterium]
MLHTLLFLPAIIGIVMAIRRTLVLAGIISSFNPPGMAKGSPPFDTEFGKHPILTLIHILPGALFMITGPLQFIPGIRTRHLGFHRLNGRIYIASAYIVGISALVMSFVLSPIGGINQAAATILFAILFLVSISKAWWYIAHKEIALHREWMIRAFSIGLAIGTIRPIMVSFFAFSGLPPQVFFGTAFWIGFTLHTLAAEIWINYTRVTPSSS